MDFKLLSVLTNNQTATPRKRCGRRKKWTNHHDTGISLWPPKRGVFISIHGEVHPTLAILHRKGYFFPSSPAVLGFCLCMCHWDMPCWEDTGFLKAACRKKTGIKPFMYCSSHSQVYLVAACKDQRISKLTPRGVTDIFKWKQQTPNSSKLFLPHPVRNLEI